jgi:predicted extracellular nuclease
MKKRPTMALALVAIVLSLFGAAMPATAATGDPVLINEVLSSHTGTDDTEYVELYGIPGTSLAGLSLIVVEGDENAPGNIDRRLDFESFHAIGSNGFFLIGNCGGVPATYGETPDLKIDNNFLENSSHTVAIVETASLSGGTVSGGEVVRDAVALADPDGVNTFYFGAPVIGPDGSNLPAGARRVADGVDTDTAGDWVMADFYLGDDNTPTGGGSDGCTEPVTELTIPEIQGAEQRSPYEGTLAGTSGVVTLYSANGRDFWLQDADGDGDPATSDGIVVDDGGYLPGPPQIGDYITIVAEVVETQYGNQLPLTRLDSPRSVVIHSSGNPLPEPVPLIDLPNVSVAEGIAFWEPLEGMLVSVSDATVVAATSPYGEFGMLTDADIMAFSGYRRASGQLFIRRLGGGDVDYNPERIMVDDTSIDDPILVQPGDRVNMLVGALDYTFGMYKIQPATWDIDSQPIPAAPVSSRSGALGDTRITTFNVENLFDLETSRGRIVDSIGQLGSDPGSEWGSGDASTQDNTIRRNADICAGDTVPDDPFDPAGEWTGYAKDTIDGLGAHSVTCGPATDLFISEYVEGGSFRKAIEIYNATGGPVDLSAGAYAIEINFNGSPTPGNTIMLSGVIADGDVFVLAHSSAGDEILAVADQASGSLNFNGDDAVLLRRDAKDDASSTPEPEELEIQLTKLALAIEVELELPEIIIVQEAENQQILQVLGDRVNASAGTAYVATSFETSDARGIEAGFLWDANRVSLLNAFQLEGPDVEAAFGPNSASPGREPIVGVFDIAGREVTIVGNHFKSKGGDDPVFGVNWPPVRVTETQRKMQAQVVRDFVNSILGPNPHALVMVAGDLNDFQFAEPGEGTDHPVAIVRGHPGEVPLINLIMLERPAEKFTYVYDGNSQVLDHMLVSPALFMHFRGVDILHFNTSYPAALISDPTTPLHCSDHDPIEGRFQFTWSVTPWSATWSREQ